MSAPDLAILYRGPFAWQAGLEVGLLAIRRAVDAGVTLAAVYAGEGPERERLLYTIHDLALEAKVRVLAGGDGRDPVGARAVFLWPALRAEGLASLREARRGGAVIVGSDLPEVRALVGHGEDGLLVAPRDPDALARALLELAREPARFAQLAEAAGRRASEPTP